MQKIKTSLALIALGVLAVGGCHKSDDSASVTPTTMTAPPTNGAGPTTMPFPRHIKRKWRSRHQSPRRQKT